MRCYRLKSSLCAVVAQDGKRVAVTLPTGALIRYEPGQVSVPGLVDVMVEREVFSVFEQDLTDKGERVIGSSK